MKKVISLDNIVPVLILITLLVIFIVSCSKEENSKQNSQNKTFYLSDCLSNKTTTKGAVNDSIYWIYTGDSITINHFNAAQNCCILDIDAILQVNGDTITISEEEILDQGGCCCICLYNFSYKLPVSMSEEFVIVIDEEYLCPGDKKLIFKIPAGVSQGSCVETRSCYPWM